MTKRLIDIADELVAAVQRDPRGRTARADRRAAYEYLQTDDEHWQAADGSALRR